MPRAEPALLVATLAALLQGRRHVVVGANLPIPAAAALLARHVAGGALRVEILGSRSYSALAGLADLYDFACQGRFDAFFLSPGQIDGQANVNLVGVGKYPHLDVRWPGSHGSPLLYMMIPNVILFRDVHLKRVLVPRVDFISAPGVSARNVFRPGGPTALVTSMARLSFDRDQGRFRLEAVHPEYSVREVIENTGFSFDCAETVRTTPIPDDDTLDLIGGTVGRQVAEVYPQFAESLAASAQALRASVPPAATGGPARSQS